MKHHKFSRITNLIIWAFVPVVFFIVAIFFVKWYADNIGPNDEDIYSVADDMDWGKVISGSPDVKFEITDSLKYYRYADRELLKQNNIYVANISRLFPDLNATILLLEKRYPILTFDKGGTSQKFEIRQKNGAVYYGRIRCNKDMGFYLKVARDSIVSDKANIIPLGKFYGKVNMPKRYSIDVAGTTINVVSIVTLVLCILGLALILTTENIVDKNLFLLWVVLFALWIPLTIVVGWLFNWWQFYGKVYNFPEWIALFWALSEIGLLGGVIFRTYQPINPTTKSKDM